MTDLTRDRRLPVTTLSAGQYFGEAGLLTGTPRKATVTVSASGPARALVIDRADFKGMLEETEGLRGNLAQTVLRRLRSRVG